MTGTSNPSESASGRASRKRLPVTSETRTPAPLAAVIAFRLRSDISPRELSRVPSRSRASKRIDIEMKSKREIKRRAGKRQKGKARMRDEIKAESRIQNERLGLA